MSDVAPQCEEEPQILVANVNAGSGLIGPIPVTSTPCFLPQAIPGTTTTIWLGADVEPTIAVNPTCPAQVVAAWQSGRISNGAALEAGIAYSSDWGLSWKHTVVPFQLCLGGQWNRVSDTWLSWSVDGKRVYLNVLVLNVVPNPGTTFQSGIATSYSEDGGATWSIPVMNIGSENSIVDFPLNDKNTITADTNNPCNVYSVWDKFIDADSFHSDLYFSRSTNQGTSWFPAVNIYDATNDLTKSGLSNGIRNDNQVLGAILVSPPSCPGKLLIFFTRIYAIPTATDEQYMNDSFPYQYTTSDLAFIESCDGGINWSLSATRITGLDYNATNFTGGYTYTANGQVAAGIGARLRSGSPGLFDVGVNPRNGYLYVVYEDTTFRSDLLTQIGLRYSIDGGRSWSESIMVNRTPQNVKNPQAFCPAVAISGNGYIAVLYSDLRFDDKSDPLLNTRADVWLALYKEKDCGLVFVKEFRLSPQSYILQHGPLTSLGYMTNGDYPEVIAVDEFFYATYTIASPGPFVPATEIPVVTDPPSTLLLDTNRRTSTFVSLISTPKELSSKKLCTDC